MSPADVDPDLDVTLSNGRRVLHFHIAAVDRDLGIWAVTEPHVPRRVRLGWAGALAARQRLDAQIAARLDTGWVPADVYAVGATALPPDLRRDVSYLGDAITRGVEAVRAADPTGQLWAAWVIFRREAQRVGIPTVPTRRARAQRDRRLGALAEQAGDHATAIQYYQASLAAHATVGIQRRLARLQAAASPDATGTRGPRRPVRDRRRRAC